MTSRQSLYNVEPSVCETMLKQRDDNPIRCMKCIKLGEVGVINSILRRVLFEHRNMYVALKKVH